MKFVSILFVLGFICSAVALTTYTIGGSPTTLPFDGLLGQPNYTSSSVPTDGSTAIRQPSDLVFSSKGGLYVTDTSSRAGRVLYYANPAINTATYALGAENVSTTAGQLSPTGIALYSVGGADRYLAVAASGLGYSKFYNISGNTPGAGSDPVNSVAASIGGVTTQISGGAGTYLALAVQASNGDLYFADSGNNRVVVEPANGTSSSLPSLIYGVGASGLSSSCNASSITCFSNPTAVAVDCTNGVWVAVTGVANVTFSGVGILYFPAGTRVASALYFPNTTSDFTPNIFGISFNSDCSKIAFSGSYRVYVADVTFIPTNPLITINPSLSKVISLGVAVAGGAVPPASANSDSLYLVQNTAFDINNKNRLAIADVIHNRVVFLSTNASAISPSITPSLSVSRLSSSTVASASQNASASNFTTASASPNVTASGSSSVSYSISGTISASAVSSSSVVNINVTLASVSPTASSASAVALSSLSASSVAAASPSESSPVASYTTEPSASTPSSSESGSYSTYNPTGSAMRIQSWVQLF